jgi:O-antigen ligase
MEGHAARAPGVRTRKPSLGPVVGAAIAGAVLGTAVALGSRGQGAQLALLVAGFPLLVASALLAARRPVWSATGMMLAMASAGALAVNGVIGRAALESIIWLLLLGLFAAMVAGRLNADSYARPVIVWPGVVALGAYLAFTALQIPFAETLEIGVRAFMDGPVFILAFFALAYSRWDADTRRRIAQGFVIVAIAAGGYALWQLVAGPTSAEQQAPHNYGGEPGDLSLFGSFGSRQALGAWTAIAAPALFVLAVALRGRWRWLTAAALALTLIALLGSELRVALVATAAGIGVAIFLYQLARAFRGEAVMVLLAVGGLAAAGIVGFAVILGSDTEQSERYERILTPEQDRSFQRRLAKWDITLAEINDNPLGQGLGTVGTTQRLYSREIRIDDIHIDNSYLQLGVQQGYPGWILFGLSVLLIGYRLVLGSVRTPERQSGMLGIAAAASLASWLVLLMAGENFSHWGALLLWLLLGLGVGGLVNPRRRPARPA